MKGKILIVEDEQKLRGVLCDYLSNKGEIPFEARDGMEALKLLEEHEFDAVLLDIMMPKLNGLTQYVFRELSEKGMEFAAYAYRVGQFDYFYEDYGEDEWVESRRQMPGAVEYAMNRAIEGSGASIFSPSYDYYPEPYLPEWLNILRGGARCETAIAFLDGDGTVLRQDSNFLYFGYVPQEEWDAGRDNSTAYGWIDLGEKRTPGTAASGPYIKRIKASGICCPCA